MSRVSHLGPNEPPDMLFLRFPSRFAANLRHIGAAGRRAGFATCCIFFRGTARNAQIWALHIVRIVFAATAVHKDHFDFGTASQTHKSLYIPVAAQNEDRLVRTEAVGGTGERLQPAAVLCRQNIDVVLLTDRQVFPTQAAGTAVSKMEWSSVSSI